MGLLEVSHPTAFEERKSIVEKFKNADTQVNGHVDTAPTPHNALSDDDFAVLSLRNLLFDICNQNGGGHGGSAIGMAAIGVALFKYIMRYNPSNPEWFDRDRFVLSNGENCKPRSSS